MEEIEDLARAEKVSLSKVVSECFEAYSLTPEYKERLKLANDKLDETKNKILSILGTDVPPDKLRDVIDVLSQSQ